MFYALQGWVLLGLQLLVLVLCIVALVDAARRPAGAFTAAGKLTKNAWLAILAVAAALAFVSLGSTGLLLLAILAAVASLVYLFDVKPAVTPYSGRGGRPGTGGW